MLPLLLALPLVQTSDTDAHALVEHIDSIFTAYVEKDRATILRTHTFDWLGYQSRSASLVRGLDAYMANADLALENGRGSGYELLETAPRVHGEVAVVPYVARYWIGEGDQAFSILYRSIDVYRRDGEGWNQYGTNLCVMSDDPPAYPSAEDFERYPQLLPVAGGTAPEPSVEALAAWERRRPTDRDAERLRAACVETLAAANDPAALNRLRTDDWVGFELGSTSIVHRDGDVAPAGDPWTTRVGEVELVEFEAQLHEPVAVVYALLHVTDAAGGSFRVRTAELYRRDGEGWRQCAAHPNPVPATDS